MPDQTPCDRRLGSGSYKAQWINKSLLVRISATGILPCYNYEAELEPGPQDIEPPIWEMIFYTEPLCLRAIKPFMVMRVHPYPAGSEHVTVRDATGDHKVPIEPAAPLSMDGAEDAASVLERRGFEVHSLVPADPPHGCIIVPGGSIVPAIYTRVFGPADMTDCEDFVKKHCEMEGGKVSARGGDVPWPLAK